MFHRTCHALCGVSAQRYKTTITSETRKAIAGLDADVFGFSRAECGGPVPAKLLGRFRITDHVFLNTAVPPTEWAKRTQNVALYAALERKLREELPSASIAVCHTPDYPANIVFRFHLDSSARGQ
ncbi:hypothetical protein ABB37_09551 [Leptomonas pyrrhocoris]|uniref:Uncharacterized protein n=1 Tax=Leptomonas pyrrhocoris TaxID=157538 RepID=A0A0N0VD23_LEPPY|nr:hypothetical protein ABB37_09551 [Leptomonas pyrrhocoris]XP_015652414.1 hypothetical protein ABB37_09551 [Leptomonas pyrrhocoris]XP_015652415.1 hypothetical protein ABB37_09551 [Leptomonas pyrrhocoris]XP_015652416.1 hypothetical protein ABB37_09551 [Leptomonas pyrrhocoris]KPA73974.1 hypothetical protein ABB37_09551 [Leptomonas pyrrhocoris]KPA73975.1 hypothetical protein ABB37_09551 [Leptomonas pyrrhocoris]KPA73976.1 hypothetical protein ABB37_09551 [Leptomonas pyrrhocoris]KPA73977.1 hypot|eukprot:XP_015652413.1 hypothetical protein ABB37_09551 [Leptomonas pyrrhocoris]